MENQTQKESKTKEGSKVEEGLPMKESPYLQHKDLEDYKRQGYGTEGHKQPTEGRGAGATEAPTLSGSSVNCDAQFAAVDAINRNGVP